MQLPLYLFQKLQSHSYGGFFRLIQKITIWSIAVAVFAVLFSLSVYKGFLNAIESKISRFGGDLEVTKFDLNRSYELQPFTDNFWDSIPNQSIFSERYAFIQKVSVLISSSDMYGTVLRGVSSSLDTVSFRPYLMEGKFIPFDKKQRNSVVLSQKIADKLQVGVGDTLTAYFFGKRLRWRKVVVTGIYETAIQTLDEVFVYCDISFLRKFNRWQDDEVGGWHLQVQSDISIDSAQKFLENTMPFELRVSSVQDRFFHFFHWFNILGQGIQIILLIVFAVVGLNIVAALFVLVLERSYTVGVLKTVGAAPAQIRFLFFGFMLRLLGYGLLWGNGLALIFIFIQKQWKLVPLKKEDYFIEYMAVDLNILTFIVVNICCIVLVSLVVWLATWRIEKISPIQFLGK